MAGNTFMTINKQSGFTLIEVLIALVILAIALIAVVKATDTNIHNLDYLRDKITAQWVADNVLANMQAGLLPTPQATAQRGAINMLDRLWYWQAKPEQQMNNTIKRINIAVTATPNGKPLIFLIGFVQTAS
jgi:general secretion pathway protein I